MFVCLFWVVFLLLLSSAAAAASLLLLLAVFTLTLLKPYGYFNIVWSCQLHLNSDLWHLFFHQPFLPRSSLLNSSGYYTNTNFPERLSLVIRIIPYHLTLLYFTLWYLSLPNIMFIKLYSWCLLYCTASIRVEKLFCVVFD